MRKAKRSGACVFACALLCALTLCGCSEPSQSVGTETAAPPQTDPLIIQTSTPEISPQLTPTATPGPQHQACNVYAAGVLCNVRGYVDAENGYAVFLPVEQCVTLLGGEVQVNKEDGQTTLYTIHYEDQEIKITLQGAALSCDTGEFDLALQQGVLFAQEDFFSEALGLETVQNEVGDVLVEHKPEPTAEPDPTQDPEQPVESA